MSYPTHPSHRLSRQRAEQAVCEAIRDIDEPASHATDPQGHRVALVIPCSHRRYPEIARLLGGGDDVDAVEAVGSWLRDHCVRVVTPSGRNSSAMTMRLDVLYQIYCSSMRESGDTPLDYERWVRALGQLDCTVMTTCIKGIALKSTAIREELIDG